MQHDDISGPDCSIASFFKLVLEPRGDLQTLEIPKKFMKSYGDDLSNIISLNIPTGEVWEFTLVRENDKSLLGNGWLEFVEFYSISHGHCLMFHYQGNSRFDVVIFDMSASEIMYPCELEPCSEDNISSNEGVRNDKRPASIENRGGGQKLNHIVVSNYKLLTLNDENPSFAVKMQPAYVSIKGLLVIPRAFANKYFKGLELPCEFILHSTPKETWVVRLISRMAFSSGWRPFVVDNKLEKGDICIFELIGKQELKVTVLRSCRA